jgi:hypothetical protein
MGAGLLDYPVISSGSVFTTIDTYNSALLNNAAQNNLGISYSLPVPQGLLASAKGQGAPLVVRYVRFNSTANPSLIATPAPVYWTDETFTTVSGVFTEGNPAATGNINSLAGFLLPNSTALGLTGAASAAALNGNFCFIAVAGFLAGVTVPASTAVGDSLTGAAGNFTLARVASGTAPTAIRLAQAVSAINAGVADILIDCDWA